VQIIEGVTLGNAQLSYDASGKGEGVSLLKPPECRHAEEGGFD